MKVSSKKVTSKSGKLVLLFAAAFSFPLSANATTNCVFVNSTKSMTLQGSCTTDETIIIPNGLTLNGQGFKITAIDPVGGNFKGPILRNAGKSAGVANLFLRTNLADFCQVEPADKLVGILFDKAAGTIAGVNITLNKAAGASTCEEGTAIQLQSLPYSSKGLYSKVTVKTSSFNYNQLAGIVAQGNINLRVEANLVRSNTGSPIAQRGIEASNGVKALIVSNEVIRHSHSPLGDPSYGILLNGAASSTVLTNTLNFNDIGIRVSGTSKVSVKGNIIRSSTLDGILVDDSNGLPASAVTLWANDTQKNGLNGIRVQSVNGLTTKNITKYNIVQRNIGGGIVTEGSLNKIQSNTATLNDGVDISDFGTGNLYSRNTCESSTGAPVDCPPLP